MKYQIGKYVLDVQARTLTDQNSCQNIRPKTLALLLYLAQRAGSVISKQELLDSVWDDVNVDDGVIFQSVREVRQLFSNTQIIQNHPRKGYEFTEQIRPFPQGKKHRERLRLGLAYVLPFALISLLLWFLVVFYGDDKVAIHYEQSIVVLPIKNHIPYGENDWIYLGGMEQLIAKLKGLPSSVYVYQGDYIPRLMHIAGLKRDFQSSDVARVFKVSGASLIVETEVHGNVYDYKLVYKFHLANDLKQGVILDSSINGALTKLSEKLAAFINRPLQSIDNAPAKEFSDALFAEAMISYESDWQTSISFFESYLALNPDSVIALFYLSKLYLWSGDVEQAAQMIEKASKLTKDEPQNIAHVDLIKGKIAARTKHWQQAMRFYQQAASMIEKQPDWFLKASIAEAQGEAYLEQHLLDQSLQAFDSALKYYQIIQSPIGINSTQLHVANVLFQQGHREEATRVYRQAEQSIQHIKLEFLYSMLEDYERSFSKYLQNNQ